jgi:hypothetical protein
VTRTKVILNHVIQNLEDGEAISAQKLAYMYDTLCDKEDVGLRTEESAQRFCTASELFNPVVKVIESILCHDQVVAVWKDDATMFKIQSRHGQIRAHTAHHHMHSSIHLVPSGVFRAPLSHSPKANAISPASHILLFPRSLSSGESE